MAPNNLRMRESLGFAEVYEEEVWRVYAFISYRVKSRADAEDLTQQTFERALRAWSKFDPDRATPATWLTSIARNLVIDHYRRHRGDTQALDPSLAEQLEAPAEDDGRFGLDPELERALATLGEREREVIALRFGADLTGPEIAELTGLSLANVQQILSRSLRRLRELLLQD